MLFLLESDRDTGIAFADRSFVVRVRAEVCAFVYYRETQPEAALGTSEGE
ncbi:MAG: hypothetical protein QF412_05475 [Planctomycetota bacterium]|nr:hypothetical protein [Planctomycetota bacterium]